jgi:hypothetical protein
VGEILSDKPGFREFSGEAVSGGICGQYVQKRLVQQSPLFAANAF